MRHYTSSIVYTFLLQITSFIKCFYVSLGNNFFTVFFCGAPIVVEDPRQRAQFAPLKSGPDIQYTAATSPARLGVESSAGHIKGGVWTVTQSSLWDALINVLSDYIAVLYRTETYALKRNTLFKQIVQNFRLNG